MVDEKTVKEKTVTADKKEKATVKKAVVKKPSVKTATKTTGKDKSVEKTVKTDSKVQDIKAQTSKNAALKKESKTDKYTPRYSQLYNSKIVPSLMKKFNYSSVMEVPKIKKITLNMGIGDAKLNSKALDSAVNELTLIAAQKAVVTLAKKDVSNFKIRKGFPVGCTVNIRGKRMYEFFERLNSVALPRTRDFRGLSFKSFDRRGNYNFGIKEQIIFTEINYDKIDAIRGLDIAITTSAKTDEEAYALLKEFGFPLRDKPEKKNESVEAA
jgi:large subunit ribosomal protein L5